jgi:hypothetical protein
MDSRSHDLESGVLKSATLGILRHAGTYLAALSIIPPITICDKLTVQPHLHWLGLKVQAPHSYVLLVFLDVVFLS